MIAPFDDVNKVWGLHLAANTLKKIQRTEWVARALHEEDRCRQQAQNFIAQLCPVAHAAERISKTNDPIHFFFKRDVTPDTSAHAFADQNDRCSRTGFCQSFGQCLSMCGDQLWQRIGTFPVFAHIRIIERLDIANLFEVFLPALHPRMRRWRAGAGSKEEKRAHKRSDE